MPRGAVFHGINGNILFRCMVNELHKAMSFSLAQEIEPIRKIAVRPEHVARKQAAPRSSSVSPPDQLYILENADRKRIFL